MRANGDPCWLGSGTAAILFLSEDMEASWATENTCYLFGLFFFHYKNENKVNFTTCIKMPHFNIFQLSNISKLATGAK